MSLLEKKGYHIYNKVYTSQEVDAILMEIAGYNLENKFGVRNFLFQYQNLRNLVFNQHLRDLIEEIAPGCNKLIKSIYFDKPPSANWIVNWHQDLTINLKAKKEQQGYKNWRVKLERTIVQPNLELLENIFTLRVHLDRCTRENGALRVIEKSHRQGIIDIKGWDKRTSGRELVCEVERGGVLLMSPLILHASRRTENKRRRRVIHMEFCRGSLPKDLEWNEAFSF